MPREMYLITAEAPDIESLVMAGMDVDPDLGLRAIFEGNAYQLVDAATEVPVLTIENPRQLQDARDAVVLSGLNWPVDEPGWWTQASAPWGAPGEPGVAIVRGLATRMGGQFKVADGQ